MAPAHQRLRRRQESGDISEIFRRYGYNGIERRLMHGADQPGNHILTHPLSHFYDINGVTTDFRLIDRNAHADARRQIDRAVNEAHRPCDQIVAVINACHVAGLRLRGHGHRHHTGQDNRRGGRGKLQIGQIANAGLNRSIDIANDARSPRNRRYLHGAIEPTGLGGVDRDDLCRALLDDLNHVVRIPGALIGHHRHIDRTRDLCQPLDTFHGLLEIDQIALLHAAKCADSLADGAIALICVDAERDVRADRVPDPTHHFDVAIWFHTYFDFDRANAFACRLRRFALRFLEPDETDGMSYGNFAAQRPTKEAMDRKVALLAR